MPDYVRARPSPLAILEGPKALPEAFGNITGFHRLGRKELARHGWYPYRTEKQPEIDPRHEKIVTTLDMVNGYIVSRHHIAPLLEHEVAQALGDEKRRCQKMLASIRWKQEAKGVLVDGHLYQSDRASRTSLMMAAMMKTPLRWKLAGPEWVDLSAEQLEEVATALHLHAQACFDHEAELSERIRKCATLGALDAIDLKDGWP